MSAIGNAHVVKSVCISGAQPARLAGLSMHFELSASDRVTMNGWVQNPCPFSTLARWPLWTVSGQC